MNLSKQQIYDEHLSVYLPQMFTKMSDKDYELPDSGKVWSMVKDNYINEYKYIAETFDCDDFALVLHAWVRQEQYRNKWPHPWAFGEAWGEFGFGNHALNIAITADKGLLIVEPQTDSMRAYEKGKDIFSFIRM